jgi:hypothetical protein
MKAVRNTRPEVRAAIALARDAQRALIAAAADLKFCPSDAVIAHIAELETKTFSLGLIFEKRRTRTQTGQGPQKSV